MKQKIKEALKTRWSNQLGIKDETVFEGVAASVETLITSDEQLTQFVEGAKAMLTQPQSYADKVRTELNVKIKGLEGEKAELEAKLNGNQTNPTPTPNPEPKPADDEKIPAWAQAILDFNKALSDKLAGFEAEKAVNDTIATVNARIDAWGYGKGYPAEMAKARTNAMELYEAYGKKWTPDELEAKIKEKFNMEVRDKGLNTSEPFKGDGGGGASEAEKNSAFAAEIRNALGLKKE